LPGAIPFVDRIVSNAAVVYSLNWGQYTPLERGDISHATDDIAEWIMDMIETPELGDVIG
jgi:hypothetical protein